MKSPYNGTLTSGIFLALPPFFKFFLIGRYSQVGQGVLTCSLVLFVFYRYAFSLSLGPMYRDCCLSSFLLLGLFLLGADGSLAVLPGGHRQNEVTTHSQALSVPRLGWVEPTSATLRINDHVVIFAFDESYFELLKWRCGQILWFRTWISLQVV